MLGKGPRAVKTTAPWAAGKRAFSLIHSITFQTQIINFAPLWIALPESAVVGFARRFPQVKNSDITQVSPSLGWGFVLSPKRLRNSYLAENKQLTNRDRSSLHNPYTPSTGERPNRRHTRQLADTTDFHKCGNPVGQYAPPPVVERFSRPDN